jgi:uncharacterized phiE125 gp8 family phage protein
MITWPNETWSHAHSSPMSWSIATVTPPYAEPVTVNEAKAHVKADADVTEEDSLIAVQISAARDYVETATGACRSRQRVMIATTFDLKLDFFAGGSIHLPRVPLVSLVSITYVDVAGLTQTVPSTVYTVDYANAKIDLAYSQYWPSVLSIHNAVTVRFIAGMAAPITAVAATDTLTVYGRTYAALDRLQFVNSGGSLPAPLGIGTVYEVLSPVAGAFAVNLIGVGSALDITSPGSGGTFATADAAGFQVLRQAILLQVASYYRNRGDGAFVRAGSFDTTQDTIDALIASQAAG